MDSSAEKIKPGNLLSEEQVREVDAAIRRGGYSGRQSWAGDVEEISGSVVDQIMSRARTVPAKYADAFNDLIEEELLIRYSRK